MDAGTLYAIITQVCPLTGTRVVDPNVQATWSLDFAPSSTPAQQTAALALLATLTPASQPPISASAAVVASHVARLNGAAALARKRGNTSLSFSLQLQAIGAQLG